MVRDCQLAIRALGRDKTFALGVLLTMVFCLSANSLLFSIVNSVLLRPLPLPDAERLVILDNSYPKAGVEKAGSSAPDYVDRLNALHGLGSQALFQFTPVEIGEPGAVESARGMQVTPSFFELLKVRPAFGWTFRSDDEDQASSSRVVLSFALSQSLFSDGDAIGRAVRINARYFTVLGVMPRDFLFLDPDISVWMPVAFSPADTSDQMRHANRWVHVARLSPTATIEQVQAQVDALNAANLDRFPQFREFLRNAGFHTRVLGLQDDLVAPIKRTLHLLWAGAGVVLLMGSFSVATMASMRWRSRRHELAIRTALGAKRIRLVSGLLFETTTIGTAAGIAASAIAVVTLPLIGALGLEDIPRRQEIVFGWTGVAFTLSVGILGGVAMGIVPAMYLTRGPISVDDPDSRIASETRTARRTRRVVVVMQVGCAYMLLIVAGVLLSSFRQLLDADPGFNSRNVFTASVSLPPARYPRLANIRAFTDDALEAIRNLPGVLEAGVTSTLPLAGEYSDAVILPEDRLRRPDEPLVAPSRIAVSQGYFRAMGIRVLRGRSFSDDDRQTTQRVVLLEDRLARRFWPDEDPVGKRVYLPSIASDLDKPSDKVVWLNVVGVVADTLLRDWADGRGGIGAFYVPFSQDASRGFTFAVKTGYLSETALSQVRRAIASRDRDLPSISLRTMDSLVQRSLSSKRSAMMLAGGFSIAALLLSLLAIYSTLAYSVTRRTHEIGIRVALGPK